MKARFTLLALAVAVLFSLSLSAQDSVADQIRYEGQWPNGEGVLYSGRDGLIIGTFHEGKAEGRCCMYSCRMLLSLISGSLYNISLILSFMNYN
mgnify:CR=1 FL=1